MVDQCLAIKKLWRVSGWHYSHRNLQFSCCFFLFGYKAQVCNNLVIIMFVNNLSCKKEGTCLQAFWFWVKFWLIESFCWFWNRSNVSCLQPLFADSWFLYNFMDLLPLLLVILCIDLGIEALFWLTSDIVKSQWWPQFPAWLQSLNYFLDILN
jgi:hypothetical protein